MTADLTDDTTLRERIAAIRSADKAGDPLPVVDELLGRLSECGKAMHCCPILSWRKDDFDESKWSAMLWVAGEVTKNLKPARARTEVAIEMEYETKGKKRSEVILPDGEPLRKAYGVELQERVTDDGSGEVLITQNRHPVS